mmetsp:Transcript_7338/g.16083  ORF Transcript_7338/g.16083 Transcript_7338/m.16083 type:complete len:87 (+) Transcript_7338:14-274(+)
MVVSKGSSPLLAPLMINLGAGITSCGHALTAKLALVICGLGMLQAPSSAAVLAKGQELVKATKISSGCARGCVPKRPVLLPPFSQR